MKSRTEPANFALFTIPRLKAYRKTLYAKIGPYEHCFCGSPSCDYEIEHNRNNPLYLFYKSELERVNAELGARQKKEALAKEAKEWPNISITVVEENRKTRERKVWEKKMKLRRKGFERAVQQQTEGMARRRKEREDRKCGLSPE